LKEGFDSPIGYSNLIKEAKIKIWQIVNLQKKESDKQKRVDYPIVMQLVPQEPQFASCAIRLQKRRPYRCILEYVQWWITLQNIQDFFDGKPLVNEVSA
jgi:hypothetical protein